MRTPESVVGKRFSWFPSTGLADVTIVRYDPEDGFNYHSASGFRARMDASCMLSLIDSGFLIESAAAPFTLPPIDAVAERHRARARAWHALPEDE